MRDDMNNSHPHLNRFPTEAATGPADYLRPVWRFKWIVLVIVAAVAFGVYKYFDAKPRVFTTASVIYVGPSSADAVLTNVVTNAIKYTPDGGEIVVSGRILTGFLDLMVRDTGIGISPEHLPSVFQRFYRVDKARSREQGGAGLGLSIAQSIVEAPGGRIELDSVAGQGTNCAVKLPLQEGGA